MDSLPITTRQKPIAIINWARWTNHSKRKLVNMRPYLKIVIFTMLSMLVLDQSYARSASYGITLKSQKFLHENGYCNAYGYQIRKDLGIETNTSGIPRCEMLAETKISDVRLSVYGLNDPIAISKILLYATEEFYNKQQKIDVQIRFFRNKHQDTVTVPTWLGGTKPFIKLNLTKQKD